MSGLKNLRYQLELAGVKLVRGLATLLPRRLASAFGALLGWKAYRVFRFRRRVSLDNIERARPFVSDSESADRIACASYVNLGRSVMEFAAVARLDAAAIRDVVDIEGRESFDQALEAGRGAVVFTGHFGNWELGAAAAGAYGYPVHVLAASQANPLVDREINRLRGKHALGVIHRESELRKVFRALERNEFVAFAADQDARRHGTFVDFLGRPASSHKGPALFAVRRNAPVVAGFIHRVGGGRHTIQLHPPMWPDPSLAEDDAVGDLMQRYTDALADAVRKHPTEYLWAHRRWKSKPA
jgi:KDO2-lipid IV(A) lauroyltransferase